MQEGKREDLTDRRRPAGENPQAGNKIRIHREGGYDSRYPIRHNRKKARRKTWVRWAALAALAVIGGLAAAIWFWAAALLGKMQRDPDINIEEMTNPNIDVTTQQVMRENWTIAVFGVDSRDGSLDQGANADVIMLCNLNEKTGGIRIVSIYRDTCMKVGERNPYKKINEAYARGGIGQAVEALNENLDVEIDDYAAVNWKAVADAINLLGGIDVELTEAEFRDINGYITSTVKGTGVGSVHLEKPGLNHLDGVQTVAYARLRYMDSDFQRTERQREVLSKALDKAKDAEPSILYQILNSVLPETKSSFEADSLFPLIQSISKFHLEAASGFPFQLEAKRIQENGAEIDYVFPVDLADNVAELHQFLYGTEDYQVSSQVKAISQAIEEKSKTKSASRASAAKTSEAGTSSVERTTRAEKERGESLLETSSEMDIPEKTDGEEDKTVGMPTTEGFSPTAPELFIPQAEDSYQAERILN